MIAIEDPAESGEVRDGRESTFSGVVKDELSTHGYPLERGRGGCNESETIIKMKVQLPMSQISTVPAGTLTGDPADKESVDARVGEGCDK